LQEVGREEREVVHAAIKKRIAGQQAKLRDPAQRGAGGGVGGRAGGVRRGEQEGRESGDHNGEYAQERCPGGPHQAVKLQAAHNQARGVTARTLAGCRNPRALRAPITSPGPVADIARVDAVLDVWGM